MQARALLEVDRLPNTARARVPHPSLLADGLGPIVELGFVLDAQDDGDVLTFSDEGGEVDGERRVAARVVGSVLSVDPNRGLEVDSTEDEMPVQPGIDRQGLRQAEPIPRYTPEGVRHDGLHNRVRAFMLGHEPRQGRFPRVRNLNTFCPDIPSLEPALGEADVLGVVGKFPNRVQVDKAVTAEVGSGVFWTNDRSQGRDRWFGT